MLSEITPLIITYDEEANIGRTLSKLTWAHRVVVIDSGSVDETLGIIQKYKRVDVIYRKFDNFANQCNFGLTQVHSEWVLSLDADYELSEELIGEMGKLQPEGVAAGYRVGFTY